MLIIVISTMHESIEGRKTNLQQHSKLACWQIFACTCSRNGDITYLVVLQLRFGPPPHDGSGPLRLPKTKQKVAES